MAEELGMLSKRSRRVFHLTHYFDLQASRSDFLMRQFRMLLLLLVGLVRKACACAERQSLVDPEADVV